MDFHNAFSIVLSGLGGLQPQISDLLCDCMFGDKDGDKLWHRSTQHYPQGRCMKRSDHLSQIWLQIRQEVQNFESTFHIHGNRLKTKYRNLTIFEPVNMHRIVDTVISKMQSQNAKKLIVFFWLAIMISSGGSISIIFFCLWSNFSYL